MMRRSDLSILAAKEIYRANDSTPIARCLSPSGLVDITSETVIPLNRTLTLSGLSQREAHTNRTGVPVLIYPRPQVPLFEQIRHHQRRLSSHPLAPRDLANWGRKQFGRNKTCSSWRAAPILWARQGTPEDWQHFQERYQNWEQFPPNRFASNSFMMKNSEFYRKVSGENLTPDQLDAASTCWARLRNIERECGGGWIENGVLRRLPTSAGGKVACLRS